MVTISPDAPLELIVQAALAQFTLSAVRSSRISIPSTTTDKRLEDCTSQATTHPSRSLPNQSLQLPLQDLNLLSLLLLNFHTLQLQPAPIYRLKCPRRDQKVEEDGASSAASVEFPMGIWGGLRWRWLWWCLAGICAAEWG